MQLEKDFHALLHGRKDGEVVVKNENPHTIGGIHEVIDEVHKNRTEEEIKLVNNNIN
jgi:hypothetical protein